MQIISKGIDELVPYENNPRHNKKAVEYVANSIRDFGFRVPLVIDKNGVIVAGHTRYEAARKLGINNIPCIVADDLSEDKIRAFRVVDNKVSEYSMWDEDKLIKEMQGLVAFDMSEYGFPDDFDIEESLLSDDFSRKKDGERATFSVTLNFDVDRRAEIDEAIKRIGKGNVVGEIVRICKED